MDDACMKTAIKNGFWLTITTWALMAIFIWCINLIHDGLTIWFLRYCCENDFDVLEISKGVFWICIFNIVLSLFLSLQTTEQ